jgi:peptidoglycan/LPS O-acetylase OafA/YrhL
MVVASAIVASVVFALVVVAFVRYRIRRGLRRRLLVPGGAEPPDLSWLKDEPVVANTRRISTTSSSSTWLKSW